MRGNVAIAEISVESLEPRGLWATRGIHDGAPDSPTLDLETPLRQLPETDDESATRDLARAVVLAAEAGEWLRVEAILRCLEALLKE